MRRAVPVTIAGQDRDLLHDRALPVDVAARLRIVLLAAEGWSNTEIAGQFGVSVATVARWRTRYAAKGVAGLVDRPRSGRPRHVDRMAIVAATLQPPPEDSGLERWSCRALGDKLGLGEATVARAWQEYGLAPRPAGAVAFSVQPKLVAVGVDLIGVYLVGGIRVVALLVDDGPAGCRPHIETDARVRPRARHVADASRRCATAPGLSDFLREIVGSHRRGVHVVVDGATTSHAVQLAAGELDVLGPPVHLAVDTAAWLNLVDVWAHMAGCHGEHPARRVRRVHDGGHKIVWVEASTRDAAAAEG